MEMDAGSKLSPEQRLDDWREGEGGAPFLLLLPPGLQDSFNEGWGGSDGAGGGVGGG